jgi:probable F420-dependent oxidoreductase
VKLGFSIPNNQGVGDARELVQLAQAAETHGYNSVWVSEHLFHSTYVAQRLGNRPYHDPLTVLTAIGCSTATIRLGTSVLVLPWHHPARLGKAIATLDHLSGGRVDLGVGVAITEDEFDNLGVDFASRGRRADDALAALQALWSQDLPAYDGEFYRFSGQRFEPKPLQAPLPIHVGGGAPAALRRVAAYGQGWHALGKSPAELAQSLQTLFAYMQAAGRDPAELHISIRCVVSFVDEPWDKPVAERRTLKGTPDEVRGVIQAYAEAGVHELVVDANSPDLQANMDVMTRVQDLLE